MNAVIYARYSSDSQREESIEGQLRECREYAERNNMTIVGTYIDRALSAKTADRPEFQRMIKDSAKELFEIVLVWKLDRFSRDRYDSAHYKHILKKNGVKVVSAKEHISEGPEGIILEAMLEGYAEFYSAELSEKIHRGQKENALKGKNNGGGVPLGYLLDKKAQRLMIDPVTAPLVMEIFEKYADGKTVRSIAEGFNARGLRTKKGQPFNINSFSALLKNRKYIGEYRYQDVVIEGGVPAIIPEDLFNRVQERMEKNRHAPAMAKAKEDYLLTTKLFCGKCERMMVGESGTSHTGTMHYYYKCGGAKRRKDCDKKAVRKDWIERVVVRLTMQRVMDEEKINRLIDAILVMQEQEDTTTPALRSQLAETESAIGNILKAIEQGIFTPSTKQRLDELEARKEEILVNIQTAELQKPKLTREQMTAWFEQFRHGDPANRDFQKRLIDTFVNAVYVFDDKLVLTYNYQHGTQTISLGEIESALSSDFDGAAPPIIKGVETSSDLTERKREDRPSVSPIRYSATDTKKEAAMHNGSLLIDMHVHLARYEVLSASTRDWFISLYPSEAAYQAVCEANASPDDFCAMLAEKGVDYAVILAEDTPAVTGVADNRMVADFCKGHPQLLPFCTFDPLKEKDMPGQLRQLAAEGFRGVKLYPTYNFFYPNAPMMYPLYETAQELGLPVLFHTGLSVFKSSRLKYGSPIFYDDIAVDFPELKIVMCHGGRDCWYREAFTVARLHKNVYIDVAGLPPKKLLTYFPDLPRLARKFVFGTDWPSVDIGKNADAIAQLPLPEEDIRAILGETAKRLLGT